MTHLSVSYAKHRALDDVSLSINEGDFIALMGPNGGGKSTLLKTLCGLVPKTSGNVTHSLSPRDMAYLPQHKTLDHHFPIRVRDVVCMGLFLEMTFFKRLTCEQEENVFNAIERVGLKGFENTLIHHLSGGQFQRMLFARLMMQKAKLLLLDEPFAAIDRETTHMLLALLQEWNESAVTLLVVLHDLRLATHYFPKTLILSRKVKGFGLTKDVFQSSLSLDSLCLDSLQNNLASHG